jgi:hypothetical protein
MARKELIRYVSVSFMMVSVMLLATGGTASAHVLKEDQGVSAVLHIPPDDSPAAGEPTELDLSFGDDAHTFSLPDCNCQVIITQGTRTVLRTVPKPAVEGATLDSIITVTFPEIGVYNVGVTGSAKQGTFHSFKLNYVVRVATVANGTRTAAGHGGEIAIVGLGSIAILSLLAYTNLHARGRDRPKPTPKQPSTTKKHRP